MPHSHKDSPAYTKDKPYARWKTETNLWADMVKANNTVKEATLGQVVALNALPDGGPDGDIRGTVIDALGDTLKGVNGLKTTCLDGRTHGLRRYPVLCGQSLCLYEVQKRRKSGHEGVLGWLRCQV